MLPDTSPTNGGSFSDDTARSRPGRHRASRRQRRQVSQPSRYQPAAPHRQPEEGRQSRQTPRRALPIAAAAAGVLSVGVAAAGAGWFLFLPQGQSPTAAGTVDAPADASLSRGAGVPSFGEGTSRTPNSAQPGMVTPGDSVGPSQSSAPRPSASASASDRAAKQADRGGRVLPRPSPTFTMPDELDPESSSSPDPESPSPTASSPDQGSPSPTSGDPAPDSPSPTSEPEPTSPSPTPTSSSGPIVDIDLDLPLPDLGLPLIN